MKKNNFSWHAVQCKPKQEIKAIKNLKNQKFEVFCPFFQQEIKYGLKKKIIRNSYFRRIFSSV